MHPEPRPRLPVQGRQLSPAKLPQDEEGGVAHEAVQEEDQRGLPHLQTAHCPLRLPNQALPGFNDLLSFGFVNDCGSAMRGNGSSWVLEPISCLPWQSAGWFDQSAARISRSNQSRLASARPTRSLARLKLGKMHLTKVNVLLTNAYFLSQMQFQPIQTCHCAVLYHIFAHITMSRRQNARFHSA